MDDDGRRTDVGPWVSYKLTFGSGELKVTDKQAAEYSKSVYLGVN